MLFAASEEEVQRGVDNLYSICIEKKLKVNVGKSKVMVFERKEVEVFDVNAPYRVSVPAVARKV